ncbi:MAG: hypothetical protein SFW35_00860 [Chitinophagales bacterium]|nr:hypothetical protein [Chitinophagales bacterium]
MAFSIPPIALPNPFVAVTQPIKIIVAEPTANQLKSAVLYLVIGNKSISLQQELDFVSVFGNIKTITFDIHDILQDYIGYQVPPINQSGIVPAPKALQEFSLLVLGYDSNGYPLGLISQPSSGGKLYAVNAALQYGQFHTYLNHYVLGMTPSNNIARFMTNAPREKQVALYESEFLSLMAKGGNASGWYVYVLRKRMNGDEKLYKFSISQANNFVRFDIGTGPANINALAAGLINEQTQRYEVKIVAENGNLFPDGSNGTMDTSIIGLTTPKDPNPSPSSTFRHSGAYSLKQRGSTPVFGFYPLLSHATPIVLQPNGSYLATAFVYIQPLTGFSAPAGLSILLLTETTPNGLSIRPVSKPDLSEGNLFGKWLQVSSIIETDNQQSNFPIKLVLMAITSGNGLLNSNVYIDDISIVAFRPVSESRTYVLDHQCHEMPTRVHFLNRLGAFDSYTFTGLEKKTLKTKSNVYDKNLAGYFTKEARGRDVQSVQASEVFKCSTDALRPEEIAWLEELLTSPAIFIQRNMEYIPVVIANGSFETMNTDKNFQRLIVEFEMAKEVVLQRN